MLPDPTEGSYDWAKAGEANTVAIARATTILMTSLRSARVDGGNMLTLAGKMCEAAHTRLKILYTYSLRQCLAKTAPDGAKAADHPEIAPPPSVCPGQPAHHVLPAAPSHQQGQAAHHPGSPKAQQDVHRVSCLSSPCM